jgi:long-subunit fatty acid transport protein
MDIARVGWMWTDVVCQGGRPFAAGRFGIASRRLQPRRRLSVLALVLTSWSTGGAVRGSPLDDPHIGGVGFSGPTTGDLAAVFWNPAALGLLQGSQVTLVASEQLALSSIQRSPIDRATGAPGGAQTFPEATGRGRRSSLSWPPGPGTFLAIGTAVGNRFTLAVALYTPFAQRTTFGATADGHQPARYHMVEADLRNVALVPALAFRIGNELRLGFAPGFMFSTGRLVFDEDTALAAPGVLCDGSPCGVENPAAAARYTVGSGLGVFDASVSFTLAAGMHFRRGRFEAALAYASPPLGTQGGGVVINAPRTDVTPPPRLGAGPSLCPPDQPAPCMFGRIGYDLPAVFTGAVTWHATPTVAVTVVGRWLTFSRHERIDVRVVSSSAVALRDLGIPDSVRLFRGLRDVIEGRVRVERELAAWLRVGAAVRVDTGAVAPSHLSPGVVAGPTVEPAVMVELRAPSWLRVTAGYALAVTPARTTETSVFDPTAAVACENARGDLATPECYKRLAGAARPTAAGRYSALGHTASLNATFRF